MAQQHGAQSAGTLWALFRRLFLNTLLDAVVLVFCVMIWAYVILVIVDRGEAQPVYFNLSHDTVPHEQHDRWAMWSANERLGLNLHVAGETDQGCVTGGITFRAFDVGEKERQPIPEEYAAVTAQCEGGGFLIVYDRDIVPPRGLAVHEILHALGYWSHTFLDANAALYPYVDGNEMITTRDALLVLDDPHWTPIGPPSLCHNEIAPDFDLYIPEIGTTHARFNYIGPQGGFATWSAQFVANQPFPQGCTNNEIDEHGRVVLTDIRGMNFSADRAVFEFVALQTYRLVELAL